MNEELRPSGSQNWRVKVYLLNAEGNWDDCGSGTLSAIIDTSSGIEIIYLSVVGTEEAAKNISSEITIDRLRKLQGESEDLKCVMKQPIKLRNDYEKQGDSIITWADEEIDEEIALSFLDTSVTRDIWHIVCKAQGRIPPDDTRTPYKDLEKLLMPSIDNLEQIKNDLDTRKNWMIYAIIDNPQFLYRLYEVLQESEQIESLQNLHMIHEIIRQLIFADDIPLLELLLSDEHYLLVFGALEYDLDIPKVARPKYREFLENRAHYRKVIDFKDETIVKKIRLNFRINYLKDSVINSIIDDPISNMFNPVSYYISHDIYEHIMENDYYFDELFTKMTTNLRDSIGFLYELTQIVKAMVEIEEKTDYCQKLLKKNIYSVISNAITALYNPEYTKDIEEEKLSTLKINIVDILFYIIQLELGSFIDFLQFSRDSEEMVQGIINNLFYGDQGLQVQTGELIKFLMDTIHERKNETLDIFYDRFLPGFVEHYKKPENNEKFYSFVQQLVEILIHCLRSHSQRIRQYIITHKLLQKLYPGFKLREKSIHLAILRFVKNILLSKDDLLINYLSNHELLDDIFDLYLKNAFKNNLINSACLEFFEIFVKENLNKLIIDFVERFRDRVSEYGLQKFFFKMFNRYEQITGETNLEASERTVDFQNGIHILPSSGLTHEQFSNYTVMEKEYLEDEEYFENEDDEYGEDKKGYRILEEKPNDENSPFNGDHSPLSPSSLLSDEQLKTNKDCLTRMKNKMASKKLETEEGDKFTFGNNNKGRKMSSSSDRQFNSINIQLNLTLNNNEVDGLNTKREGFDLMSDEELNESGQLDPQKRLKIQ